MIIGLPRERKHLEFRVGLTPGLVAELVRGGHRVLVEADCGLNVGFENSAYSDAGAEVLESGEEVYARADLLVKVKEPQPEEIPWLRPNQILFTFLHLAANQAVLEGLLASGCIGLAYENVVDESGRLPILRPMSQIAGAIAIQEGIHYLERPQGTKGLLLAGVEGADPARVVILGGGAVGSQAARQATALGARLTLLDASPEWVSRLQKQFGDRADCRVATQAAINEALGGADLVIGAALVPGAKAPTLVTGQQVKALSPGTVLVDVAIDQGGCFATSRATSLDNPVFQLHGCIHYCVDNMPSAVARTATQALCNVIRPYVLTLAEKGLEGALQEIPGLQSSVSVFEGEITNRQVADTFNHAWKDVTGLM